MNRLYFLSALFLMTLFMACNSDSSTSAAQNAANAADGTAAPGQAMSNAADNGQVLSQTTKIKKIQFSDSGDVLIGTFQAEGTNLDKTMVEDNGLTTYEAQIASMVALSSVKCAISQNSLKMTSFVYLDGDNRLLGRFDFPCSFSRRLFSIFGPGATHEFQSQTVDHQENLATNTLKITATNLAEFQQMVKGLEPQEHNGVNVGEIMK